MSERARDVCIEPVFGATYRPDFDGEMGVYEYGTHHRSSVLAGRTQRTWLDSGTLDEMKAKYPTAQVCTGTGYVEDLMRDLPDEDGHTFTDDEGI